MSLTKLKTVLTAKQIVIDISILAFKLMCLKEHGSQQMQQ